MTTPTKIQENTFAEACYNMNSVEDLSNVTVADEADMAAWGLSESEYFEQIQIALENLIADEAE